MKKDKREMACKIRVNYEIGPPEGKTIITPLHCSDEAFDRCTLWPFFLENGSCAFECEPVMGPSHFKLPQPLRGKVYTVNGFTGVLEGTYPNVVVLRGRNYRAAFSRRDFGKACESVGGQG